MSRVRAWLRRLGRTLRPDQSARDIDEEMRLHLELETEKYVSQGLDGAEARRRARMAFGAWNSVREDVHAARGVSTIQNALLELRFALRVLRRSPVLTVAAALTLAIGIGANTAVFGIVNATLLRPLPFPHDDELITLHRVAADPPTTTRHAVWSWSDFDHVRAGLRAAGGADSLPLAAWYADDANLRVGDGIPEHATTEMVSAGYFEILGVGAVAGRTFSAAEDAEVGTHPVAVIRERGGSGISTAVVGSTVMVNGVALDVIGVMPASFRGLSGRADVWITNAMAPLVYFPGYLTTDDGFLRVVGRTRLEPHALEARLSLAHSPPHAAEQWEVQSVALREARLDPQAVRAQTALAAAASLLLLIAVVNFSGLLLARANGRMREVALRTALGAGRAHVVRGMLVESALIGLCGGALGVAVALFATGPLTAVVRLDPLANAELDWRAVAFATVLSVLSGIAAGVVPALRASRGDVASTIRHSSRSHTAAAASLRRPTLLSSIAVIQFAAALVLLVGAGVLLQGFRELRSLDPGIRIDSLLTFRISPSDSRYSGEAAVRLLSEVLDRVSDVPGVRSATIGRCLPGTDCSWTPLHRPGIPEDDAPIVRRHYVAPEHFHTLGIPLLRGRLLTNADRAGSQRVAVINEYAARRLWPGEDALGRRVWFGSGGGFASPDSMTEIVGVVADVRYGEAGSDPEPDFYTSYQQYVLPETMVIVRASAPAASLLAGLRSAVAAVDPSIALHDVRTPREISRDGLASERAATFALTLFAAIGMFLAAVGVYGLLSWSVSQRRREIGIRLAVGATPDRIRRDVVRDGVGLAAAGLGIGGIVSLGFARTLSALIPGLGSADAGILIGVSLILITVATITCYLPARAASRVDPCTSLSE